METKSPLFVSEKRARRGLLVSRPCTATLGNNLCIHALKWREYPRVGRPKDIFEVQVQILSRVKDMLCDFYFLNIWLKILLIFYCKIIKSS